MSPILSSILTAAGGVLAGLALAGPLLWRQQQALNDARYAAEHDDTTGLPNRRALLAALTRSLRGSAPCGVVLLDLDGFKAINDTFGHDVGNDALTDNGRYPQYGPDYFGRWVFGRARRDVRLRGETILVAGQRCLVNTVGPGVGCGIGPRAYTAWITRRAHHGGAVSVWAYDIDVEPAGPHR